MILPIGVEHPLKTRPLTNWAFLGMNVVLFLFAPKGLRDFDRYLIFLSDFGLRADSPKLHQFLTYMFMHGDWMHLLGNMLSLYVFGNYVNQALGNLHYFIVYLVLGLFSGLGHVILVEGNVPLVGASGAIMGVMGMFLALHGRDKVRLLLLLVVVPVIFSVPSAVFIMFMFGMNVALALMVDPNQSVVAHWVHIFGFLAGFSYIIWLMIAEFQPRSSYDILSYLFQTFPGRNTIWVADELPGRASPGPVVVAAPPRPAPLPTPVPATAPVPPPAIAADRSEAEDLMQSITRALDAGDEMAVTVAFKSFERRFPMRKLPEITYQHLANFFYKRQKIDMAISMCQRCIRHFPHSADLAHTWYVLGSLYAQSFEAPYHARNSLEQCLKLTTDPALIRQAEELLARLPAPGQATGVELKPLRDETRAPEQAPAQAGVTNEAAAALLQRLHEAKAGNNAAAARQIFEELRRRFPTTTPDEDTLQYIANLYYAANQHRAALNVCRQMTASYPNSPNAAHTNYVMGLLLVNFLGEAYEGRKCLQLCINLTNDDTLRARAEELLTKAG